MNRQIIIEFKPEDGQDLVAPVIFSYQKLPDGRLDAGFAIVTDEPPLEIQRAGHDRCPVLLQPDAVHEWLDFAGKSAKELDDVLARRRRVTFVHKLAEAA